MGYAAGDLPVQSIVCIAIAIGLSVVVPIGVLIYYKMQTKGTMRSVLTGILMFVVFALLLEQLLHWAVLGIESPVQEFLEEHWWAYALYVSLAAGIFEETARLLGYKLILRKEDDPSVPLMYGVGHGGVEAVLISGFAMIGNLIMAISGDYVINEAECLAAGVERVVAFALQIGLSVLVFMAVKNGRKKYFFPLAILIHAAVDFPAAMYQTKIIDNLWIAEGIVAVAAIGVCILAGKQFKTLRRDVY